MAVMGKEGKGFVREFLEKIKKLVTPEVVEEDLTEHLAGLERSKRKLALAQLLELIHKQEGEIRKIKPESRFAEDGSVIDTGFTKETIEALRKAKEKLAKLESVFEKGLKGEMADVYNLVKDKGGGGKESSEGTS